MQKAKLFTNGRSQAVRLPKEFRLPGDEVYIRREGNKVVLIPIDDSWQPFVDSLGAATDDFMTERDQGEQQAREKIFPE
jgi:antitoxin VapB